MPAHLRSPSRAVSSRAAFLFATSAATLAAAGCSGDEREFVEAIEIRELSLADLDVAPPPRAIEPLTLSPGQSVDLDLAARDESGEELDIDVVDRQWSVDDPAIGTVDRNGRFTARAEGSTSVGLEIGGFTAAPLELTVSDADLSSISRVEGPATPERCVGSTYYAVGAFDDGSERLLLDARWSVADDSAARLRDAEDGAAGVVRLVPTEPGPLALRVAADGRTDTVDLDVADTLQSIAIDPVPAGLAAGGSSRLTATGTFTDADGGTRPVDVTDTIDFGVDLPDTQFGSVSNLDDGTRGLFEATAAGNVTVRASCGSLLADPFPIAIGAGTSGGDAAGGLAFDRGSRVTLSLTGNIGGLRVRVSTGSDFDNDAEVTDVRVVSDDERIVSVDDDPIDGAGGVLLFPIREGRTTVVARDGGVSAELDVTVVQ